MQYKTKVTGIEQNNGDPITQFSPVHPETTDPGDSNVFDPSEVPQIA